MVVKVIGSDFNDEVVCSGCGKKLQFETNDVTPGNTDIDGDFTSYDIACPNCGRSVSVASNIVESSTARSAVLALHKQRQANEWQDMHNL